MYARDRHPTSEPYEVWNLPIHPVTLPPGLANSTRNGRLPNSDLADIEGGRLHRLAAASWRLMHTHASRDGLRLVPVNGSANSYRTYFQQVLIFQKRFTTDTVEGAPSHRWNEQDWYLIPGLKPAAVPGTSTHGWGIAVDVFGLRHGTKVMHWLLEHAHRYGWGWELESEPWHIVYYRG